MKTPSQMLGQIQTRGEFRELNALAERESCSADRKASISPDSPIWDAWEAIKAFYPGSTTNWDSEPPMMWAHVLSDLNLEQLATGVKNLVHHRDSRGSNDFPPNAGQFRDLCLTNFDWESQAHRRPVEPAALEDLTAKEKRRQQGLDEIKKLREQFKL
jgi:hypothetical protein